MRIFLISLILLGLASFAPAQEEHKRAAELYKRGSYADALVLLEESIQTYPDWYYPILLKGQCNQKMGKLEEALRNYNDALTLEIPSRDIPRVKNYMAKAYMSMKHYKKAVKAFTDLLDLVSKNRKFDIFLNRGQCEMQIAKSQEGKSKAEAKSYFSKAIVSFSNAINMPTKRADLKIEASFQKAYAQYQIGNITGGIGSLENSIQAFQDVISRNPKEKRAHKFIIDLQFSIVNKSKDKINEYLEVVDYIDRYLDIWPRDDTMLNRKGLALQGAKKYADAINVFELVLRSRPKDADIFYSLGSCQMGAKRYRAAIANLNKARINGLAKDARVYSYIANCYAKQKNKCYGNDIPLEKSAIGILAKGVKATSGQASAALQKELRAKKANLKILEGNLETDNTNHLNTMENIRQLSGSLGKNTKTLQKNREMYIEQPTEELKKAIDDGNNALAADKKSLAKEYKKLAKFISEAKKCSADGALMHYKDMVALLKTQGK